MVARIFDRVLVARGSDGRKMPGQEIICGACGARDAVVNPKEGGHLPPEAAIKKFKQRGWRVGSSMAVDRCPSCAAAVRTGKVLNENEPDEEPSMAPKTEVTAAIVPSVSVDVKRRINAKLMEVWTGGEAGYARGWTDQKVAEALGVPRAAVAGIRTEFYGDAQDNPDIREFLERADVLFSTAAEIEARTTALLTDAQKLVRGVDDLQRDAAAIRKAVAA